MFVQSAKFIENHGGNIGNISIFGQEYNSTTSKMSQMNLAIHGIEPDLGNPMLTFSLMIYTHN